MTFDAVFASADKHLAASTAVRIAYPFGNIVDLLAYIVESDIHVDLMSDQTSCHAAYDGGYCPQGLSFAERTEMLAKDRPHFIELVKKSLRHQYELIKACCVDKGTYFFDYGNSFLKAVYDAGVKELSKNGIDDKDGFILPSYVEDIMGPQLFDYGYGPFRLYAFSASWKTSSPWNSGDELH